MFIFLYYVFLVLFLYIFKNTYENKECTKKEIMPMWIILIFGLAGIVPGVNIIGCAFYLLGSFIYVLHPSSYYKENTILNKIKTFLTKGI